MKLDINQYTWQQKEFIEMYFSTKAAKVAEIIKFLNDMLCVA